MTLTIKCQYYLHIETSKLIGFSYRTPPLDFNFSAASRKLNILPFANKIKFDDSNICIKLLVMEQKIINNCLSDTLISLLKWNFWVLNSFLLLKYGRKLQTF